MAEQELKIKVTTEGTEEAKQNLDDINESLGGTEIKANSVGEAFTQFRTKLGEMSQGAGAAQAASTGLSNALKAIEAAGGPLTLALGAVVTIAKEMPAVFLNASREIERQSRIIQASNGNISEAATRIGNLVSNIDLMTQRNRIAATGLNLTDREFANLAVTAQTVARATGGDATQAFEQLSEAISEGSAEALSRFGIELDGVTEKADVQQEALRQLEERYGNTSVSADGFASSLDALDNELENVKTSFIEGWSAAGRYDDSMQNLYDSASGLVGIYTDLATVLEIDIPRSFNVAENVGAGLRTMISNQVNAIAKMIEALTELANGDFRAAEASIRGAVLSTTGAGGSLAAGVSQMTQNAIAGSGGATTSAVQGARNIISNLPRRTRPTGGGGGAEEDDLSGFAGAAIQNNAADAIRAGILPFTVRVREENERILDIEKEKTRELEAQTQALQERAKVQQEAAEAEFNQALVNLDNWVREQNMQRELDEIEEERERRQQRMLDNVERFNSFTTLGVQIAQTAVKDGRKAARESLKDWLKQFSIKEALSGGRQIALGIGAQNPKAKVEHFTAAGKHFALAAAAGGGAGGLAAMGGGGGGGSSGRSSETSGVSPTGGASQDSREGETIVININGQSLLTEGQIGREINNAMTAYQARY